MLARASFIFILLLPLIEIALLIVVGQAIGLLPTLAMIVLTGLAGVAVLRWQGMGVLRQMRERFSRGEMPARQMGEAVLIGLAGVLLLLPGVLTDIAGLILLLPATRRLIYRLLAKNMKVVEVTTADYREVRRGQIELERGEWRDGPSL